MRTSELARCFKEREERVLRAYRRGQASPYEVQFWACLTALAASKDELGGTSHPRLARRARPPRF